MRVQTVPVTAAQGDSPTQPCLWQLRSRDEAAEFWHAEFGHLDADAQAPATAPAPGGAAAAEQAPGGSTGQAPGGGSGGEREGSRPMVFSVASAPAEQAPGGGGQAWREQAPPGSSGGHAQESGRESSQPLVCSVTRTAAGRRRRACTCRRRQ